MLRPIRLLALAALFDGALLAGAPLTLFAQAAPAPDASRMPPVGWVGSPKQYDALKVSTDLLIPTRDGKRMATDVYRPARHGVPVTQPLPVLLNRTPYNKAALAELAVWYAERGYVVALQDTRGRYKSEGAFSKVQPADATDGYDVIEWLAKQP